ncbi:cold and drought-regulated protein CORA-like [Hibiscus syriacus]|uniref:cold and drought-regulated protein CORA-like n=1 Tax=Hibiscus syriacus TaxID=106335 RepID=UPI00192107D1|nr:cold and drought-regulated protein CORA-like [Hibiscus syriacus]
MGSIPKSFLLLPLLSAVVLLIASEVAARDLAQTTNEMENGEVATETTDDELGDDKSYSYGGGYGGRGKHGGYSGHSGGKHGGYGGRSGGKHGGYGGYESSGGKHGGYSGHGGSSGGKHGGYGGHGGYEADVINNED